jgi:flagellar biosynthesis protein FlhF
MKIKSYYSRSVEDAIAAARQELGPEAMLVNSRRSLPEARRLGEHEVIFVVDAPEYEPDSGAAALAPAEARAPERLSADVSELKRELEAVRRALTRSAYAPLQSHGASPGAAEAYAALTATDLSPELARAIVDAVEGRLCAPARGPARPAAADSEGFEQALLKELQSRISAQPTLGRGEPRPHIVALVGPPGSGKTTTLVKLAVNYGLASRRPTLLLSMDTYRVAAAEQLRSYAAILGVGFQVLETVTALAQNLEENRGKELIFIDTPGLGFGDLDAGAGLARFLSTRQDIDTHLVLPSSMKPADLTRVVDAFGVFGPRRLLFTRIDETHSFGPIVNETVRTGLPVSFLATGQRIPEDLEAASSQRIVELMMAGRSRGLGAAA